MSPQIAWIQRVALAAMCILAMSAALVHAQEPDSYAEQLRAISSSIAVCRGQRLCLIPTENIFTLIELNTMTGQVWRVQFSTSGFAERFAYSINTPIAPTSTTPGRFTLYPTQNMHNLILLDNVTGAVWQVQWGGKNENFAEPIPLISQSDLSTEGGK